MTTPAPTPTSVFTHAIRKMPVGFGYEVFRDGVRIVRQEFEPNAPGFQPLSYAQAVAYAQAEVEHYEAIYAENDIPT